MLHLTALMLQVQQSITTVATGGPSPTKSILGTELATASGTAFLLEWLKDKPWAPFVAKHKAGLNRIAGAISALIVSAGITYTWSATTNGGHQVVIDLPTGAVILSGLWVACKQWAIQEYVYRSAIMPNQEPKPVVIKEGA